MMLRRLSLALTAALAAPPALADSRWQQITYPPAHAPAPEYAQVIETRPVYQQVQVSQPRQECWQEPVAYRGGNSGNYWFTDGVAGSVVGAIAGGVAGHQFGKGRGKDAATALGAIIGAGVGQRVVNSRAPRYDGNGNGYETRCRTLSNSYYEQRLDGYDVTYRYQGRTYSTRMPYDPGARLPINVHVEPVRY
ncbi:glycine zipper 2TM domain-containing protein [Flagellatimonas centrodinii]|uniref:glycine zipper 2TM domain-containing protein n=1 Tax=Flagellatimonas centrodinii TaxID=2806210 RepID=UPI001FED7031|nr:glycine zipper 2TM domain-containing protein [Flagellatimonas centrodinii]ULQ45805.1 glycine zipper 2TM domain-containing protein [Flagellatimonas centrodinii]